MQDVKPLSHLTRTKLGRNDIFDIFSSYLKFSASIFLDFENSASYKCAKIFYRALTEYGHARETIGHIIFYSFL